MVFVANPIFHSGHVILVGSDSIFEDRNADVLTDPAVDIAHAILVAAHPVLMTAAAHPIIGSVNAILVIHNLIFITTHMTFVTS